MRPIEFAEANTIFTAPEGMSEVRDLHALVDKNSQGHSYVATMWQPSEADKEAIAAGRPIILNVIGVGVPPLLLFTTDGEGNPNLEETE